MPVQYPFVHPSPTSKPIVPFSTFIVRSPPAFNNVPAFSIVLPSVAFKIFPSFTFISIFFLAVT